MKESVIAAQAEAGCRTAIAKLATDIRGLDCILEGGLPQGRTTIVNGGPGTGKTVLAMEFLYRGAMTGEPGVFLSFEERVEDLRANAAAMGMDLAALEKTGRLKVVHAEIPLDAVQSGDFTIQGLLAILQAHTRTLKAKRVALDAVDVLTRIFRDPQREREEMHVLHQWLIEHGVTTVLTVKQIGETPEYPFFEFMADCVLRLDQRMAGQVRTRRLCVLKYRGSHFLSNEHPYVISRTGIVLMPVSSMTMARSFSAERVSAGNETLNGILNGGYPRGSCILIAGPSGVGKTSLACTFAREACRRGENTLYVSYETSQPSLCAEMLGAGIDLKAALDAGKLRILGVFPESKPVEEHLLQIMDAIDTCAVRHLVLDAVSACERMGSEQGAFDFLVRLIAICKSREITCLLTNQTTDQVPITSLSGMGIASLVDTLIGLRYADDGWNLRRRLVVVKSRGTPHSPAYHDLAITDQGVRIRLSEKGPIPVGEGGGQA
jgi:circadian clock protein KaiC